ATVDLATLTRLLGLLLQPQVHQQMLVTAHQLASLVELIALDGDLAGSSGRKELQDADKARDELQALLDPPEHAAVDSRLKCRAADWFMKQLRKVALHLKGFLAS